MKEIAEKHNFKIESYGSCAGDNYRHETNKQITLKIIECKNRFVLNLGNGNKFQNYSQHFEQTLVNNGL